MTDSLLLPQVALTIFWSLAYCRNVQTTIESNFVANFEQQVILKFVFSKKATKIDKIFSVDLTLTI